MTENKEMRQLLDAKGNLINSGFCRHMCYVYDKHKTRLPYMRLKEWDFYQIHFDDRYVLQLTFGHISYAMQIAATIIDLQTGKRTQISKLDSVSRLFVKNMPANPEVPHSLRYLSRNLFAQFEVTDKFRRLSLTATDRMGIKAEINLLLTNVSKYKDKMVIAVPFAEKRCWYLNYKENCFVANGHCRIEDVNYDINNGFALLDWGRGVWPYKHEWVWGNGGTVVDGKHFGFNIGWGFGNSAQDTENVFFYDNVAYKLEEVKQTDIGTKVRYADKNKRFVFEAEPIYDNFTKTRAPFVNNKCHQIFGKWHGKIVLDDGTTVKIPPFIAFCEHAVNKW